MASHNVTAFFSSKPDTSRRRPAAASGSLALCALVAAILVGCGDDKGAAPAAQAGGAMPPPPQVGVIVVQPQSVPVMTELPGRLEAVRTAEVRARVAGILQKRLFTEGSNVKAGQALFQIDSST